ncbi:hypothetical protein GCM10010294_24150 [Streptomyces griseoloalbus]|nr:hypothetical protein GCM10010294_24150 [Streptomyces griseoloalbus]
MHGAGGGPGEVAQPGAHGVPPRPPVPPQRHDCPQWAAVAARGGRLWLPAVGGDGRVRREGDGAGVFARSGWRVRTPRFSSNRFRASPRTDTPDPAPTHPPPTGATATPTEAAHAPQADNPHPHRTEPRTAGIPHGRQP